MARPYVDPAHEETEAVLKKIENRIKREYEQAMKEIEEKTADYLRRFEIKDKKWQEWVASGQKTAKEYEQWRIGQMIVGKQWKDKQDSLARDLVNTSVTAKKITKENMPEVYAINFNYGTYEAEKGAGVDTNFTLYNKDAVARIVNEDPQILPEPGKKVSKAIAEGKAMRWDKQQIQSVMMQGILQGESIPHLAKRLATKVCDSDYKAAIRNARTMTTGVQNAGRMDAFKRADAKGIDMIQMWQAVFDNRTRHEHRILDGQKRPVGEPFEVEGEKIMYPGDPTAPAHLVYNCRCTLQGLVKGLNDEDEDVRSNSAVGGMSYEEWKKVHKSESRPITSQAEKGERIRNSEINKYKGTTLNKNGRSGNMKVTEHEESTKQRKALDQDTLVANSLFNTNKLNVIVGRLGEDKKTTRKLRERITETLRHRNGTRYEDLSYIDTVKHKSKINKSFDYYDPETQTSACKPNKAMNKLLASADPFTVIGVHNHPTSTSPSTADVMACYDRKYKYSLVVGHNGNIFKLSVDPKYDKANNFEVSTQLKKLEKGYEQKDAAVRESAIKSLKEAGVEIERIN